MPNVSTALPSPQSFSTQVVAESSESPNESHQTTAGTDHISTAAFLDQLQDIEGIESIEPSTFSTQHDVYGNVHGDWTDVPVPFFDWPSQEMADFALPHLDSQLMDGFSPLEGLSSIFPGDNDLSTDTRVTHNDQTQQPSIEQSSPSPICLKVNCSVPQTTRNQKTASPIRLTNELREKFLKDLSTRISPEILRFLSSFATALYERCIQRYIAMFNTHVPLFHLPSLDLDKIPAPLLLCICAIGAIYRMERKVAAIFYNAAHQSLESMSSLSSGRGPPLNGLLLQDWIKPTGAERSESSNNSLWISQTKLLLALFETFSGDLELCSISIHRIGFFVWDFRARLTWLQSHTTHHDDLTWEAWIERESVKRIMYGYIYFCNLASILYGYASGFSMLTDGNVEMPCHHSLWDAFTAESWRETAKTRDSGSPLRLKDAVSRLLDGTISSDVPEEYWEWDPYSCCVAVNAVSIYISHMTQGLYILGEGSDFAQTNSFQVSDITNQMEMAISRCLQLIKDARVRADESYTWDETEGPLLFNSLALLRVSYCRIMTQAESASRGMLFCLNENENELAIQQFLSEPTEWTKYLNRAVSVALEGILIPTRIGSSLVKKTAAFTWAIEHAFAGWDSILLVTKWLHAKETLQRRGAALDEADLKIVQRVRDMLAEDIESDDSDTSLAATLTRSWAGFYDDTWVWGVTPKMGKMLRQLATHYENTTK
ncbi:hypothetical protein IFR05_001446 [Cadophora sp. M221]|nr:hypothetical protein IFR05_001446 [Cadophora sp. M221]